jgi:O-antigen ligase
MLDGEFKFQVAELDITYILGLAAILIGLPAMSRHVNFGIFFFLVLCYILFSAYLSFSSWGLAGMEEVIRTAGIFSIFVFVLFLRNEKNHNILVNTYILGAFLSAVFSIYQFITNSGLVIEGINRCPGLMAHPNSAALLYGTCLVIVIVNFNSSLGMKKYFQIFILCFGLLSTVSLSGIFVTVIGVLWQFKLRGIGSRSVLPASLLSIVMYFIAIRFIPEISIRISKYGQQNNYQSRSESNSLEWRVARWKELIDIWFHAPFFGQGFGSTTNGGMLAGYVPHNEYLRVLVELGLIGAIILTTFVIGIQYRLKNMNNQIDVPSASICARSLILMSAISATTENTFLYTNHCYLMAVILGIAISNSKNWNSAEN